MQLGGMTRPTTQPGSMKKLKEQIGISTCNSGLDDGKEATRPEGRGERKTKRSVPKKSGGGRDSRLKKTRDLGIRSGMVVKFMAEDGTVLEGTVLKRTTKKSGKFPNNYVVKNNTSSEVIKDVNFDQVDWYIED